MNLLLLLAHSVEEYDQVKLLSGLGYDVFSIGAYSEPANPGVSIRPALPDAPDHPELRAACQALRERMEAEFGSPATRVDWAKYYIPDEVLEWADTIICHHFEHTWLVPQWTRLRDHRVIWRTVGQSVENNETMMAPLRADGLQIVRYSPNERNIPGYAGEDVLIRFYKDPADWYGWTGEDGTALHLAQHSEEPRSRDRWLNFPWFEEVTDGLPRVFAGTHSDNIGGLGELTYADMQALLRSSRVYIYTGTQPASYTLGLLEAMMTGIPVVSIGPEKMDIFAYGPELFEGDAIARGLGDQTMFGPHSPSRNHSPAEQRERIRLLLTNDLEADAAGKASRDRALEQFSSLVVGAQWADFLG